VQVVEVQDVREHRPGLAFGQLAEQLADRVRPRRDRHGDGVDQRAPRQREVVVRGLEAGGPRRQRLGDARHPLRSSTTTGISRSVLPWYSS
jgi:hypothetical protein